MEGKTFKTKHTLFFFILGFGFIGLPVLALIPFIEMKFERVNFYIVLYEIVLLLFQLFWNLIKQYELIYNGKYLILSKCIFFKTQISIPVNFIKKSNITLLSSFKINTYKLVIEFENQKKEYKFIELTKNSIREISNIKNNEYEKTDSRYISEKKIFSPKSFLNFYYIVCIMFSLVLTFRNMFKW